MTGTASWEQIIFIVGIIVVVSGASWIAAWRVAENQRKERHDTRNLFDQRTEGLDEKIDLLVDSLEKRLNAVEVFNAGTMVVLKHIEEFKLEVKEQYEELKKERKEDMRGLHQRLDAIFNSTQMSGKTGPH